MDIEEVEAKIKGSFKGVWIPKDIWMDENLTWMEKCLWAEIHFLEEDDIGGCYASNEYLAKIFNSSKSAMANMISKLRNLGYLVNVKFNGRQRIIKTAVTYKLNQTSLISEPCLHREVNIDTNKGSNKDIPPKSPKGEEGSYKSKTKFTEDSEQMKFAKWFYETFVPKMKVSDTILNDWADVYDKLIRIDGYTKEEIVHICKTVREDDFWCNNFFSPMKLRKNNKDGIKYMEFFIQKFGKNKGSKVQSTKSPTLPKNIIG